MPFMNKQKIDNDKILISDFTKFLLNLVLFNYIIYIYIYPSEIVLLSIPLTEFAKELDITLID